MNDDYKEKIIDWAIKHPGGLWQDNPGAAAARKWLRKNAVDDFEALYWAEDDDTRKSIDRRFLPDGVRGKEFKQGVTDAMDKAGTAIYKAADTATGFMPGPVGMANWLGHLGADVGSGNYSKAAGDVAMAGVMGAAGATGRVLYDNLHSAMRAGSVKGRIPLPRPFMKKLTSFVEGRMKVGTKYRPQWSAAEGAAVRDSDEAVIDFIKNDVAKRAGIDFNDMEVLDTHRIVPTLGVDPKTGMEFAGEMDPISGVARWKDDSSGFTKVHEIRHQKDPGVFDKDNWRKHVQALSNPSEQDKATLKINQIHLSTEQNTLLKDAYKLPEEIADEAVTSNTELRYELYDLYSRIYDRTPTTAELDTFIDDLGRWDFGWMYGGVNGYLGRGIEPWKFFLPGIGDKKMKAVKAALKGVPVVAAPLLVSTVSGSRPVSYE